MRNKSETNRLCRYVTPDTPAAQYLYMCDRWQRFPLGGIASPPTATRIPQGLYAPLVLLKLHGVQVTSKPASVVI